LARPFSIRGLFSRQFSGRLERGLQYHAPHSKILPFWANDYFGAKSHE
jgi:hypothetical protein